MRRTTLMISPELKRKAMEAAQRKTLSFGEFTRRALQEAVQRDGDGQDRDPLLADRAVFKGKTPRDLAVRHDSYLYED
jgi:hypothetical protein